MKSKELFKDYPYILANLKFVKKIMFHYKKFYSDIHTQYAESHRTYHNLNHIESMLKYLTIDCRDEVANLDEEYQLALILSVFTHDIWYDVESQINEEKSANYTLYMLKAEFCSGPHSIGKMASLLVLNSKAHSNESVYEDIQYRLILDLFNRADLHLFVIDDMNIQLKQETYIANEYKHLYTNAEYVAGRKKVLTKYLVKFNYPGMTKNIYNRFKILDECLKTLDWKK